MIWMMLAVLAVCTAAIGALSYLALSLKRHPQAHPTVIVHTRDDRSIEGVQILVDGWGILLGASRLLNEGAEPDVALDGDVRIPLANVRFVQEARSPQ